MNATRHSFFFSFAEKYTVLLLGIVATMILSRLLTPAQLCVYSLGAVLVAMAQVVRDLGVGQYLIQEKTLTMEKLRAALATSLLVALLLAALVLAASGPLARFYEEPRLQLVLQLLSINFLLIPFSALTLPLLRRQLRFRAIYAINAANSVTNLLVGVSMALLGHSYMSLVAAVLAGSTASLLTSLVVRPPELPWLPGRRGTKAIIAFGAYATGGGLVDEAGVVAPDLVIGKMIDIESLALFGKTQSMLSIFNQAITSAISPVVFPLFAARDREQGGAGPVYVRTVSYMTAVAWAVVFSTLLRSWLIYRCLRRFSNLDWRVLLPVLRKSLALCAISSPPPLCMLLWMPADMPHAIPLLALAGTALATLLCWITGIFLLKHDIAAEFLLLQRKLARRWLAVKSLQ